MNQIPFGILCPLPDAQKGFRFCKALSLNSNVRFATIPTHELKDTVRDVYHNGLLMRS